MKIIDHPEGSDLIYYPEGNNDGALLLLLKKLKNGGLKTVSLDFKKVNYYSCLTSLDIS
ncbi:bacteriocin immunity protein [Proteus mirabilis]|uniref:bacteriocin immunity protein n=1 Tax=Proteus mirabilis TaxID=584 RepID=UPI0031D74816